jgi:hypothetical protein
MKINSVLLLIHLLATIFIVGAFENIAQFFNSDLAIVMAEKGEKIGMMEYAEMNNLTLGDLLHQVILTSEGIPLIGLIIGSLISLIIIKRKKLNVINALFILVLGFLIVRLNLTEHLILLFPFGSIKLKLLVTASILMSLGITMLFSKWSNQIINNKPNTTYS